MRGSGRRTGGMPETSWDPRVGPASPLWEPVDLSSGFGLPRVGEQCPANRRTWGGSGSFSVGVGGAFGGVGAVAPSAAGHCSTHRFDGVVGWIGTQRRDRDGAEGDLSSGCGLPGVGEQCPANRRTWGGSGSFSVGVVGALGGVGAVAPSAAGHCSTHWFDGCDVGVRRLESFDEPGGRDWNDGILLRTLTINRVPGPLRDQGGRNNPHAPSIYL